MQVPDRWGLVPVPWQCPSEEARPQTGLSAGGCVWWGLPLSPLHGQRLEPSESWFTRRSRRRAGCGWGSPLACSAGTSSCVWFYGSLGFLVAWRFRFQGQVAEENQTDPYLSLVRVS